MNKSFLLVCLIFVVFGTGYTGCGSKEKKEVTPERMEELRQKNIERAKRMRQQGL